MAFFSLEKKMANKIVPQVIFSICGSLGLSRVQRAQTSPLLHFFNLYHVVKYAHYESVFEDPYNKFASPLKVLIFSMVRHV